jgi:hypothetical protein
MSSLTLTINRYVPIPSSITVPESEMQNVLDTFPDVYAVAWVGKKLYRAPIEVQGGNKSEPSARKKRKRRTVLHLWYKTFRCHRAGEKEEKQDRVLGGKSGQARPIQKK